MFLYKYGMLRPSNILHQKRRGQIQIDVDVENAPAWGDGKRFLRIITLLEHMEKEKLTTIRVDEAARIMKSPEGEAYKYMKESNKFDKISDNSFELVGPPFAKGKVKHLLKHMAIQSKSTVFLGEAASILKVSGGNAYQHITKSGLFEKTNIRGCYKLKGAKIEEKPEIKEEVKEEITDKSLNTPRISAKIKVKPILEYMASVGLQKIRIGNAARILHTTSSDATYQMNYSGLFEKANGKGIYQLKGVEIKTESEAKEEKPVIKKEPPFARVRASPKADLVVEWMLSHNLNEIKYTKAADIIGCSIQSAYNNLKSSNKFSKVQGFGRSKRGMFKLIDKTVHPTPPPKETIEKPVKIKNQSLVIILPPRSQISTSDLDKYEQLEIPVKEQLEPENKEGYIEEEMDSDEMPKPLIKKVKVAYFCPHCGNEVIIGSTEEHRQKILNGLEKAKERGTVIGRPKIDIDEIKLIELRRKGLSSRKIASKLFIEKSTCTREVKRLEDEGRI